MSELYVDRVEERIEKLESALQSVLQDFKDQLADHLAEHNNVIGRYDGTGQGLENKVEWLERVLKGE